MDWCVRMLRDISGPDRIGGISEHYIVSELLTTISFLYSKQDATYSRDCATTFIGANNVLNPESAKTTCESMKLRDSLSSTAITWQFSTPASSHHQGTVERQIRTFKEVCEGILGADNQELIPSDFELMTIWRQAEYIMNCSPMGKFVGDQDDVKALRLIDLITGYLDPSNSDLLPNEATNIRDKRRRLSHEWRQRRTNRYLYSLQERQKWRNVSLNTTFRKAILFF